MSVSEPLPYYKWLWRDYRANRRVQRMSWQSKGLYRELLDEFWAEGPLPNDTVALADICGCTVEEFERYWPEIRVHFEMDEDGRLVNPELQRQKDYFRRRPIIIEVNLAGSLAPAGVRLRRLPRDLWALVRRRILLRDAFTCRYCGVRQAQMECDHVIPLNRGGSNDGDNLVAACFACNRSKSDKLLSEWRTV